MAVQGARIYALLPGGQEAPLAAKDNGDGTYTLKVDLGAAAITLSPSEIEIGHVVLKNDATEDHATVADHGAVVGGSYPAEGLHIVGQDGTNFHSLGVDSSRRVAVQNPPNLDAALSTRATEATLATRASEATLATRATEATLAAARARLESLSLGVERNKAVLANADIFVAALVATRDGIATIRAKTDTLGKLTLVVTTALPSTETATLNEDGDLVAGTWYAFQVPVKFGESVQLKFGVNAAVSALVNFEDKS